MRYPSTRASRFFNFLDTLLSPYVRVFFNIPHFISLGVRKPTVTGDAVHPRELLMIK